MLANELKLSRERGGKAHLNVKSSDNWIENTWSRFGFAQRVDQYRGIKYPVGPYVKREYQETQDEWRASMYELERFRRESLLNGAQRTTSSVATT